MAFTIRLYEIYFIAIIEYLFIFLKHNIWLIGILCFWLDIKNLVIWNKAVKFKFILANCVFVYYVFGPMMFCNLFTSIITYLNNPILLYRTVIFRNRACKVFQHMIINILGAISQIITLFITWWAANWVGPFRVMNIHFKFSNITS